MKVTGMFLLIASGLFIAGCSAINNRADLDRFEAVYKQGEIVSDYVIIGNKKIPLYNGDWEIASVKGFEGKITYPGGSIITNPDKSSNIGQMILVQLKDKDVKSVVLISARTSTVKPGNYMNLDKNCNREAPHYRDVISTKAGGQHDCLIVYDTRKSAEILIQQSATAPAVDWLAKAYGIRLNLNGPLAHHYITKSDDYIIVQHYMNPTIDEQGSMKSLWKSVSWARPITDFDQQAYLDTFIINEKKMHYKLKESLNRLTEVEALRLSKNMKPVYYISDSLNDKQDSIEEKLQKVKELKEKGLITDGEYADKKEELLKTIK